MRKIEFSCPNCGSADNVPAQHGTRVCRYCRTHFTFERQVSPDAGQSEQDAVEERQWANLGLIIGLIVFLAVALLAAMMVFLEKGLAL